MSITGKLVPIAVNFSLKDHTYDVLRSAILDLDIYEDGTDLRLDERQMAQSLGVSRTPVREALARLAQDGLVDIQPRRGVFVVRKSMDEILEMIVTWAALESMAARLTAERASDADMRALRKFAVQHSIEAKTARLVEYSEANIQFHQRILDLSGCTLLRTTADGLFQHMHAVRRRAMGEADRATRSVVDHMEIIDALAHRDPDLAARLVREHTMKLHDHVRTTWTRLGSMGAARANAG
ncbi:GntR family transcriptional regulator [Rhizobiaceae bacterium]|nr:GntR family transcriptional regulator [Rhizobiaceae bacterium]